MFAGTDVNAFPEQLYVLEEQEQAALQGPREGALVGEGWGTNDGKICGFQRKRVRTLPLSSSMAARIAGSVLSPR